MKFEEWLSFFKRNQGKKLFSLSDLEVLTGEKKESLSVQLSRLVKSGVVNRAARRWYENPFNPPSSEEVAMVLRTPSYLSLEYALTKHDVLSQQVYTLTLITTKQPYTYKTGGDVFEYHQIKKNLFWGFKKKGMVALAEPEKALLDLVYIKLKTGGGDDALFSLMDDMYLGLLDNGCLWRYAESYGSETRRIIKKTGLR